MKNAKHCCQETKRIATRTAHGEAKGISLVYRQKRTCRVAVVALVLVVVMVVAFIV